MTPEEFFAGSEQAQRLYAAVRREADALGATDVRVSKSQIAFRRRRPFAWVWMPGMYLRRGAPLALSLALPRRDPSPRWKQVVEPAPGRFMHHLELHSPGDVDAQVRRWLREAWEAAA